MMGAHQIKNLLGDRLRASGAGLAPGLALSALVGANAVVPVLAAWYVVASVGINAKTDAYFAAGALPQIAFALLTSTLLPVLVPLLARKPEQEMRRDAWTFLIGIITSATLLGIVLSASAGIWVPAVFRGFSGESAALAIELTRIQSISMVLNAAIVTVWLFEHARRRFIWIEATGLAANLAGLIFLALMLPRFGIRAAAWNVVFFNILKLALLAPSLGRWQKGNWRPRALREAWGLFRPFVLGQAYLRSEILIDRALASMIGTGGISLLYLGQQVYGNVSLLLGKVLIAPLVPRLALESSSGRIRDFRRSYRGRVTIILLIAVIGIVSYAAVGMPILGKMIGHGGLNAENVHTLHLVMLCLAGAFAGGIAGQMVAGTFYALGDTATPTRVSVAVFTVYLPLKIAVYFNYGLAGLALTMSLYLMTVFIVQVAILERRLAGLIDKPETAINISRATPET